MEAKRQAGTGIREHAMNPKVEIRNPKSERILVRGVNWLGDAVMTTPALLRLRQAKPEAHIALLTPEKLKDLWLRHPAIDEAITFTPGQSLWQVASRIQSSTPPIEEHRQNRAELVQGLHQGEMAQVHDSAERVLRSPFRRRAFDLAIVFPNSPRSALEVWLARIPQRIGFARPWRNFFLTTRVPSRPDVVKMRKRSAAEIKRLVAACPAGATGHLQHAPPPPAAPHLSQYLRLVAALGANPEPLPPLLEVAGDEVAAVKQKFSLADSVRWFGLNPGAEYGPAKRWPRDRFIAAATETQKHTNCRWLIFGSRTDVSLATGMANLLQQAFPSAPPLNLAGQTTLRELCALLKLCRVLLTNDTGPMHVAAAVGTPVVAVFGSTSPELTAPGSPGDSRHRLLKSDAPCSPCFRRECPIDFRCMKGIEIEAVVAAVLDAGGSHRRAGNIL